MSVQTTSQNELAEAVGHTSIGQILSVRGSEARVSLPSLWQSKLARATVGKILAIKAGDHCLIGIITEVNAGENEHQAGGRMAIAQVDLMGEIKRDGADIGYFQRGLTEYPAIGDGAYLIGSDELRLIYKPEGTNTIDIGHLYQDASITANIDIDNMLDKHFAILGSTGVGKSSGVAVILREVLDARPNLRVFMLDGHNEYGACFGDRANVITSQNIKLPFWLFNFDEFVDVIYCGRPGISEELEILSELIPIAKGNYCQYKSAVERSLLKRPDAKTIGLTVDTPVPYLIQDLINLIDERMGKLENRASRMSYHRLISRIEAIRNDSRYDFMFENANVGGDTMADILKYIFCLDSNGKQISVMQLAGLPVEVVDSVVCVLSRLAFDFGLWSDGALPMLFLCEEAHRYASADHGVGFAPARRALSRIAKEGRKYGVFLGLVTQRPAELDPTIISQCSTLFAMRMSNDRDQAFLHSAVSDAAASLLDFVPSLGTGEAIAFGEGVSLPVRMTFKTLPSELVQRSRSTPDAQDQTGAEKDIVQIVVAKWRGIVTGVKPRPDVVSENTNATASMAALARLELAKLQAPHR